MANNYTQFSEEIEDITPEEAEWIKTFLDPETCPDQEEDPSGFEEWCKLRGLDIGEGPDWYPSFSWELGKDGTVLWLYCEEGCNPDYLAAFVQVFLQKFRPKYIFTATGADFCSKLRVGEFGGWWIAVSATEILSGGCHWEAEKAAKKLADAMKKTKKGKKK